MIKIKINKSADHGFTAGILVGMGIMIGDKHPVGGLMIALFGALIYLQMKCDI